MASRARRTSIRRAGVAVAAVVLALSACGGSGGGEADYGQRGHESDVAPPAAGAEPGSAQHQHPSGAPGDGHADHEHGHASPAELTAMLVTAAALPPGYQEGHAHSAPAGGHSDLDPACAALGELLGSHPSVRQTAHPQAERTFAKSHFGPTVREVVIDYGEPAVAAAAVQRLEKAAEDCDRYLHSPSRIGANDYTVHPGPEVPDAPGGSAVRLRAVGAQFDPISWDVWWVQYGARVLGVTFRTAPGGDDAELTDVVRAALGAMAAADS